MSKQKGDKKNMIYPKIKNATVHCGYITFVHADIKDQTIETINKLGKGKTTSLGALSYQVSPVCQVVLWNR